jgi:hypothetical protein
VDALTVSDYSPKSGPTTGGTTVIFTGANLVPGMTLTFDDLPATAVTVDSTGNALTAVTPAHAAATVNVLVTYPGGSTSFQGAGGFTYGTPPPAYNLTALNPTTMTAGSGQFTLTLDGNGFEPTDPQVRISGVDRPATFVSSTRVTTTMNTSEIATPGGLSVQVISGRVRVLSNALTLQVCGPAGCPAITGFNPTSTTAGWPGFTLTVTGASFIDGATVKWNGVARPTTYVSTTQLTAAITASDIAAASTAMITVSNPDNSPSNIMPFTIAACAQRAGCPPPGPTITSLSPTSAVAGGPAFTLMVNGTRFVSGATVKWNGAARTTRFVSDIQLSADILASDIASAGAGFSILNPPPALGGLTPQTATADGADFPLTVSGTGFITGATVLWNGSARTTRFDSASQLTVTITAADIEAAGTATITAANPGSAVSNALTLAISNPAPVLTSISPTSTPAGGFGVTVTVNGTGFVRASKVRWNGADRPTAYVSGTRLSATVPAADIAAVGTASITVYNAAPGGGTSSAQTFTITPTPVISSLSPAVNAVNSGPFTLTVNGANFVTGSTVEWNGSARTTTVVSAAQLTAAITAADLAFARTVPVIVRHPEGSATEVVTFQICSDPTCPAITRLGPSVATAGGAAFTLTVTGANFVTGSTVKWNGAARTTTVVSATELTITVSAADIAAAGTAAVTVEKPDRVPKLSNTATFRVCAAAGCPTIASFNPSSYTTVGSPLTLIINGAGFAIGATVTWNGAARTPASVTATRITMALQSADTASEGASSVTVVNPDGSTSAVALFTVISCGRACPTISGLSPWSAAAGGQFTLTITGQYFGASGVTVRWNGATLTPATVSDTQITVVIPAANVANPGVVTVMVVTPAGSSNTVTFTVS